MPKILILEVLIFIAATTLSFFWNTRAAAGGVQNRVLDYPPVILARCRELGIVPEVTEEARYDTRKVKSVFFYILLQTCLIFFLGRAQSFLEAWLESYLMWVTQLWFQKLFMGCGWFCHSDRWIIPGTEDLKDVYRDPKPHIQAAVLGMSTRAILAAPVGFLVTLLIDLTAK